MKRFEKIPFNRSNPMVNLRHNRTKNSERIAAAKDQAVAKGNAVVNDLVTIEDHPIIKDQTI